MGQTNNKVYWVYGNSQTLLIPLEEEVMTEQQQIEAVPYYPDANAQVTVNLVNQYKRYSYVPTVTGNLLTITDDGTLPYGCYSVEVIVVNDGSTQYRSQWDNQVVVTNSNDPVLQEWDEFKEQEVTARAALFFFAKGDKGDAFTYEDFTQEQIEDLKKPAYDAAAEVLVLEQQVESAESLRVAAELAREQQSALEHQQYTDDHSQHVLDHQQSFDDHSTAVADHTLAASDHTTAGTDHTTAGNDHTQAVSDHGTATTDHASYEQAIGTINSKLNDITEEQFNEIFN